MPWIAADFHKEVATYGIKRETPPANCPRKESYRVASQPQFKRESRAYNAIPPPARGGEL